MRSDEPGARAALDRIFLPASIAIVGASADPAKRGFQILRALGEAGYRGRIYPVNPKGGTILGHQAWPSVASLPEAADVAVLCTPAATAPDLVRACGERGIAAAVVLAVGFRESGAEGSELESRLVDAARATGIRVVGPNTSGILNTHSGANLIGARGVRPGGLALVVQSGNMALALMNEATERSWEGISICLGVGNEADLGFAEALEYLEGHEDTRAVVLYAEGFRDARRLLETASRVTRSKPVILIKAGRSDEGARAALSHTGAVAGAYDRLQAGLAQSGIVQIGRTDELLHVAETLANQPPIPSGSGVAILSDGGGQGTLAVDTLSALGVPLAQLSRVTRSRLRDLLGRAAAVENPVDLAGAADGDPIVFARALELIEADEEVGAVLVVGLFGGYGIRFAASLARTEAEAAQLMAERMKRHPKALVVHSMYAAHRSAPLEALGRARVPVVASLEVACRCVAELHRRTLHGRRPLWPPPVDPLPSPPPAVLAQARVSRRATLTEPEARTLLAFHGVAFPNWQLVRDGPAAARAAEELGGALAVKVVSEDVLHKSDIGGVVLGVRGAEQARAAFEDVCSKALAHAERSGGVAAPPAALVTPMAPPPLAELLVGAYRDADLGPVLSIGAGGVWVEALRDVAHRLLPVREEDVRAMLDELRIRPLLGSWRGRPAADLDAIASTAVAVGACILANHGVDEIEINPLFVYEDRVVPVDARAVLAPASAERGDHR